MKLEAETLKFLRRALRRSRYLSVCPILFDLKTRHFKSNKSKWFLWQYRAIIAMGFTTQIFLVFVIYIFWYLTASREMPTVAFLFALISFPLHGLTMLVDYMWGWGSCSGLTNYFLNSWVLLLEHFEGGHIEAL